MQNRNVKTNQAQCIKIGESLNSISIKAKFYERRFLRLAREKDNWLNACYFAVSICHQTHKLYHPIRNLQGWNYLEEVFADFLAEGSELIDPDSLSKLPVQAIEESLCDTFTHDGYSNHCTLDRLYERATLLKDSAQFLVNQYQGSLRNLLVKNKNFLFNEGKGLYETLEKTNAFSDKLRKKSSFLIKLIQDAGLINIEDPENFIPVVDYHMQRVLLRMGCIEVEDKPLRKKLLNREPLESDEPFRKAAMEAFKIIAANSKHRIPAMNDFFWPLGRSCCHETTLCKDGFCSKNPCTFDQMTMVEHHNNCFFSKICKGAESSSYRKLWQPIVETHYY